MNKIIYYVAESLDGFICGPNEDISKFKSKGNGIEKYLSDLKLFRTVIMGRKTYEFGYKFGLEPGQTPYKHMENYIFSNQLKLKSQARNVHVEKPDIERIKQIRDQSETDVYLCGGGQFAGWLLENNLIDKLIIKLNPIVLGMGTRLFGESTKSIELSLTKRESYEEALEFLYYDIIK